jgi:hypothetical protein
MPSGVHRIGSIVLNAFVSVAGALGRRRPNIHSNRKMQQPSAENTRNKTAVYRTFSRKLGKMGRGLENNRAAGEVTKPVGADSERQKQKRVVADMHQVAGDHRTCSRARIGKDDADYYEQRDLPPSTP